MRAPDTGAHPHRVASVRQRRGLKAIAIFKLVKGTLSVVVALAALGLLDRGWAATAENWMEGLAMSETHRYLSVIAARGVEFVHGGGHRLLAVAGAALLYALLFFVEGIALWKERRWAEYLTIATTTLPLPIEIRALAHHTSPARIATLVVNLGVVAYLVWQLAETRERGASPSPVAQA